jgi:hypothetical protein
MVSTASELLPGDFEDSQTDRHGFMRNADGTITTFDVKGALTTEGWGINKRGEITGQYANFSLGVLNSCESGCHGFLRNAKGRIIKFDPPGATSTWPWKINDRGMIVGSYDDAQNVQHGFMRAADGTITTFDPPGSTSTNTNSINKKGIIAGQYNEAAGAGHGFVRAGDGTISTFDLPDCGYFGIIGIDDKARITGFCVTDDNTYHGFVRLPDGKLKVFDPPGSTFTVGVSIDAGMVAGYYQDDGGILHGYLRTH